jgi:hypothetical protein
MLLQLFYGKRSQFVSGLEAEVAPVSVGRSVSGKSSSIKSHSLTGAGYPRAYPRARLPGLQGPRFQRRFSGLIREYRHPGHRRDIQQIRRA